MGWWEWPIKLKSNIHLFRKPRCGIAGIVSLDPDCRYLWSSGAVSRTGSEFFFPCHLIDTFAFFRFIAIINEWKDSSYALYYYFCYWSIPRCGVIIRPIKNCYSFYIQLHNLNRTGTRVAQQEFRPCLPDIFLSIQPSQISIDPIE